MARFAKPILAFFLAGYLVLHLFSFGHKENGRLSLPERLMLLLTTPAQNGMDDLAEWFFTSLDHYISLSRTARLNQELLLEKEQLLRDLSRLKEVHAENMRLRDLLELGRSQELKLLGAERLATGASPYERVMRISRGKNHGLVQGLAVIHPQGIVGQVVDVHGETADVLLLVDVASAIDVVDQRSRARGILRGHSFDALSFEYVSKDEDLQVEDQIVSSGLDGVYPKGIRVGVVASVDRGKNQLFLSATVRPHLDYSRLEEVAVVLKTQVTTSP